MKSSAAPRRAWSSGKAIIHGHVAARAACKLICRVESVYQFALSNCGTLNMAEADLDVVIRSLAKKQIKTLADAAKKRHGRLMGMAAKAKDKDAKNRYKHIAKNTLELARAAARRMQITAENAADSYARSIKKAAEDAPATKPAKKESVKNVSVKKGQAKKEQAKKRVAKEKAVG